MRALHRPETIFSLRHVPSWLLLAAAAGTVNGLAFLAAERFVTHVTGTATSLGMAAAKFWLAADFAVVLGCFVLGAAAAAFAIDVRAERGERPLYAWPLFLTSLLIAGVALAGRWGAFGPFGGAVDQPADFAMLSALSFAMGLQNGAVATSTGLVVRTTHLTGPATDLGLNLAQLAVAAGERRELALRNVALRASKIAAFIAGATFAVPLARALEYGAFLVPAVQVALANVLSFVEVPNEQGRDAGRAPGGPLPER
jgi:uncharacterized membrane protein YoaK (UPF0700 family)